MCLFLFGKKNQSRLEWQTMNKLPCLWRLIICIKNAEDPKVSLFPSCMLKSHIYLYCSAEPTKVLFFPPHICTFLSIIFLLHNFLKHICIFSHVSAWTSLYDVNLVYLPIARPCRYVGQSCWHSLCSVSSQSMTSPPPPPHSLSQVYLSSTFNVVVLLISFEKLICLYLSHF